MAEYADAVALFPGGRGTENMASEAAKAGLKVFDFRPEKADF
jgi:predicted Rossmann-fold nucleotide-binding protein